MSERESSNLESTDKITAHFQEREDGQLIMGPFIFSEEFVDTGSHEGCYTLNVPERETDKWLVLSDMYPESIRWDGERFFVLINGSWDFNRNNKDRPICLSGVSLLTTDSYLRIFQDDSKEPIITLSMQSPIRIGGREREFGRHIWHTYKSMGIGTGPTKYSNRGLQDDDLNNTFEVVFPIEDLDMKLKHQKGTDGRESITVLDSEGREYTNIPEIEILSSRHFFPTHSDDAYFYGRDTKNTFFHDEQKYDKFVREFNRVSKIPGIKDILVSRNEYGNSISIDFVI
jgi:hypothetical protein